ncbi:MAG TPA: hypothetical protein VLM85_06490 [Polyangiaceae bacterium]|nr:hypothetical protein [Polyangiaceae bacterium]
MALGSHVPEWLGLQLELLKLEYACSAQLVAVISTGNVLWCASRTDRQVDGLCNAFYRTHIAPRRRSLQRGGLADIVVRDGEDVCVARSFAAIYVLVVWISGAFDPAIRGMIREAIPRIEILTINLPPPSPEPAEGAGKSRA